MKLVVLHHLANHLLKCAAIILSVLCWLHINYNKEVVCNIQVPLLFEHSEAERIISAPETVTMQVRGLRSALYTLDAHTTAIHIDARNLQPGKYPLVVSRDAIFLPDSVSMLNYMPCNISVH